MLTGVFERQGRTRAARSLTVCDMRLLERQVRSRATLGSALGSPVGNNDPVARLASGPDAEVQPASRRRRAARRPSRAPPSGVVPSRIAHAS